MHDDLLPGEHGRLHSRFAEAIDADPALVPPGRAAIEMAHHWHSAHDSAWALIGAWRAAAQAGRAVAAAERLSLLARVLELWDQVPDAAERIDADHVRVLEEAVAAAHDAGEFERGIALSTSALRELDPAAEPVRVADLLIRRSHFRMKLGRKDYAADLEEALEYVPADVSATTRIDILLALSHCPPTITVERSYAEEALALAREAGDEAKEAGALLTLAMFNADPGQQAAPDSGPLGLIAQARDMAGRRGAEDVVLLAAVSESHLLEGAGEHERAVEAARRATADADPQLLARTSGTVLAVNQAEPLFALGRWDDALAIAAAALDHFLAPGPMNRALLHVITGSVRLSRGDLDAASRSLMTARGALRSVRYEDQHQLPLARLEILLALAREGPAAALAAASQTMDRFELGGSSPRYGWPVVTAAAFAVMAAARLAGPSHDERLSDEALGVADRLRTVAEKLETFGPEQRAFALTFAAADADAARLIARRFSPLVARLFGGPAAGLAAASQTMDRFELGGSSPRYGWPVVAAGAFAVLAAARLAGPSHDERLRDEARGVADRLRTVAEKLERFGPEQRAFALTFAAADADAARLIAGFPDAGHGEAGSGGWDWLWGWVWLWGWLGRGRRAAGGLG